MKIICVIIYCLSANLASSTAAHTDASTEAIGKNMGHALPKAFLDEYVKNGNLDPENYGWIRWAYSNNPEDQKNWQALIDWHDRRQTEQTAAAKASLKAISGNQYDPKWPFYHCADDYICNALDVGFSWAHQPGGWPSVKTAFDEALPAYHAYMRAQRTADEWLSSHIEPSLSYELERRALLDQMARRTSEAGYNLSPLAQKALGSLTLIEMIHTDIGNTNWLKGIVATSGWPTVAQVGKDGSVYAALLALHADQDPAFQWQALHLMLPLVMEHQASPGYYAYLYDRLTEKLTGKQKYGTQFTCESGRNVLVTLENPQLIDQYRTEMKLPPIAGYIKSFPRNC